MASSSSLMASSSSPPGSPPRRPSSSSSSSSSPASPPRSFLFRRRRFPRLPIPPPSPSKNPQLIGLSFSDFIQKEFTPVMRDLFNTIGVLHYVAKHSMGTSFQTYEILSSLKYITDHCADEVLSSNSDSQYILVLALIEPAPPERPDLHPDLDDVWDCTIGPCTELKDVLKNGQVKLAQAALDITKIQATSRDILLLCTYPQIARKLEKAAHSFEAMYMVVHRQLIEEAQKDIADVLLEFMNIDR